MAITTYHNQQVGDALRQQWLTRGEGDFLQDTDFDLLLGLTDEEADECRRLHHAGQPYDTAARLAQSAADNVAADLAFDAAREDQAFGHGPSRD